MAETWEEMEARHAKERADMVMKVYRRGLQNAPLKGPEPNSLASINAIVAKKHDLRPEALRGKGRRQFVCDVRHEAWAKQFQAGHSMPKIGAFYSDRDHSTISNGIKRHQAKVGAAE